MILSPAGLATPDTTDPTRLAELDSLNILDTAPKRGSTTSSNWRGSFAGRRWRW